MTDLKVFLGGTCEGPSWRDEVISKLKEYGIKYFNPVVANWDEAARQKEEVEKNLFCNIHLYVITPYMEGCYSIAEAIESCFNPGKICLFTLLLDWQDKKFTPKMQKSLLAVLQKVEDLGGVGFKSLDDTLNFLKKLR